MPSRNPLLIGAFLVVLATIVTTLTASSVAQSENSSPTLHQFEQRIAALEARIEQLESQLSGVQQASGVETLEFAFPRRLHESMGRPLPENWNRGEINGIPFYTLPLSQRTTSESAD